jgi:hypothetical protein
MSSLTAPGAGMVDMAGDCEDDDVVEMAETPLPPLRSVFDCPNLELCIANDGKNGWKCLWCDQSFTPVHATRALAHLLKKKKCDVRVCKAIIPPQFLVRYEALYDASKQSKDARKRHHEFVMDNVDNDQSSAVGTLLDRRWGLTVDVPHVSIGSGVGSGFSSAIGSNGHPSTYSSTKRSYQPSISTSFQNQQDIRKSHNATLEFAIADFFHSENIPDKVSESTRFRRLIKVARLCGEEFVCPDRRKIGGELLDLNFETRYNANKEALLKEAKIFGLAFLGDGATVKRMALMNILGMCADTPPITVSIQDCTKHMQDGGKKDASYIARLFEEEVNKFDPTHSFTDVFFFDGASNVQKAGQILMAKFPRTFCFHGGEHVVSLFFSSIAKIAPIKVLILKTCRFYNVFGSGANHAIHAQFMFQSALANKGKKVGLLRGAGTRFATWFYAMMRLLRLKEPLKSTIHQQKFRDLTLTASAKAAVKDIGDDKMWKSMYILLRAIFPALRALRFCDASKPSMDKIFFLSHRTTQAIEMSKAFLDDGSLFGSIRMDANLTREGNMVWGDDDDEEEEDGNIVFPEEPDESDEDNANDDDDDDDDDSASYTLTLSGKIAWHWDHRKEKLEHEYAVTAWALCVMEDVRQDVSLRLNDLGGKYRDAIETVVTRLHQLPCANMHPDVHKMTEGEIIDIFWDEFKAFQNKTEPFHQPARWSTSDVLNGRSHIWHEKYSLPYTKVLGYVACRVTSKLCGIGPAERCWSAVKQVKRDKRSHLSGESTEKRSVIYMSAKQQEAKSLRDKMEKIDASGPKAMFGDDDMNFDLQLEQFGVDTNALRAPATERLFHAWVEDWEVELRYKNDTVAEARLLQKYKGLVFHDPDTNKTYSIFEENMEYRRGSRNGWFVIAVSSEEGVEDDEPFTLELACDLIGNTQQASGVKVIHASQQESE